MQMSEHARDSGFSDWHLDFYPLLQDSIFNSFNPSA